MPDILIEHGCLISDDGVQLVQHEGWLAIEGGRIAAVGEGEAPAGYIIRAGRVIEARHMAVLPGIVNGHTHLSQTFMRGLADGRPLLRWLREAVWPLQAAMTPEEMRLAALLGLAENLRCGSATVVQHHKLPGREHIDATVRAAATLGCRMVLARGWVDLGPADEDPRKGDEDPRKGDEDPRKGRESLDSILAEMEWLFAEWHGAAEGRIRIASGPLAAWRCSDEAVQVTTKLARSWGAPIHIHVAESQDEVEMQLERCGKRPIEWLADLEVLGPDVQLVHAVHVTDAELDLIAESGATVVYCPTSNMYLASGAAPVRKMLDRGIPVALGTDGSGSNNSQDMLECAKVAALLAKHAGGDAQALLPEDVFRMFALRGARLWEMGSDRAGTGSSVGHGRLVAGAPADITVVDLNNPRSQPVHSAVSALVYNASGADVHTVIVEGQILVDAGRLVRLDEARLLEESRRASEGLLRRAGVASGASASVAS